MPASGKTPKQPQTQSCIMK
ncbi:hypothetical protein MUS_0858 [Bacillus velezensis YAU B9601-Y2]|uniref:Uncharacterized protein n=3 Tax=Bacillaceae TaxID=186817 RepID=I2C2N2_BACAY|nr:hypothetical protein MUS_0858 [Bacillus velezensis YAU B9601-Y2]